MELSGSDADKTTKDMLAERTAIRPPAEIVQCATMLTVVLLLASMSLGPLSPHADALTRARSVAQTSNPFAAARMYVDPDSSAARQARAWRRHRAADARIMDKLAGQPQADWFDHADGVQGDVAQRVQQITRTGALPVLVAYFMPHRDCGAYSSGGARDARAYRSWLDHVAAGIGSRRAVVILEPDALADLHCLSSARQRERLALLRYGVQTLGARPGLSVYLDAGNSHWQPAAVMGLRLREAGVQDARGFALNVSNFGTDAQEIAYGHRLSELSGGRPFVVDTSRNGRGPSPTGAWCNPPGRGLGHPPTASTGDSLVDAFLWIKTPGESDGNCNGAPVAGQWWPSYALGLGRRASF